MNGRITFDQSLERISNPLTRLIYLNLFYEYLKKNNFYNISLDKIIIQNSKFNDHWEIAKLY